MKIWNKFYECECGEELIMLSHEDDDNYIYLAFFQQNFGGRYFLSFKERIRYIWRILTKGTVWNDMVILNKSEAKKLGIDLIEI
jgi:hypothetical protein